MLPLLTYAPFIPYRPTYPNPGCSAPLTSGSAPDGHRGDRAGGALSSYPPAPACQYHDLDTQPGLRGDRAGGALSSYPTPPACQRHDLNTQPGLRGDRVGGAMDITPQGHDVMGRGIMANTGGGDNGMDRGAMAITPQGHDAMGRGIGHDAMGRGITANTGGGYNGIYRGAMSSYPVNPPPPHQYHDSDTHPGLRSDRAGGALSSCPPPPVCQSHDLETHPGHAQAGGALSSYPVNSPPACYDLETHPGHARFDWNRQVDAVYTPEKHLPTPGQSTAPRGTPPPAALTTTDTGNAVPQRASPTQTVYARSKAEVPPPWEIIPVGAPPWETIPVGAPPWETIPVGAPTRETTPNPHFGAGYRPNGSKIPEGGQREAHTGATRTQDSAGEHDHQLVMSHQTTHGVSARWPLGGPLSSSSLAQPLSHGGGAGARRRFVSPGKLDELRALSSNLLA